MNERMMQYTYMFKQIVEVVIFTNDFEK
jgi:hypothetical protein